MDHKSLQPGLTGEGMAGTDGERRERERGFLPRPALPRLFIISPVFYNPEKNY